LPTGTLTFAAGETSKTINLSVNGDRLGEYDEYFYLNLTGATGALFLFVVAAGVRALGRRQLLGPSGLVGQLATVKERLAPEGQVQVYGEIWRAVAEGEPVEAGAHVRVVAVNGLTLKVARADTKGGAP